MMAMKLNRPRRAESESPRKEAPEKEEHMPLDPSVITIIAVVAFV